MSVENDSESKQLLKCLGKRFQADINLDVEDTAASCEQGLTFRYSSAVYASFRFGREHATYLATRQNFVTLTVPDDETHSFNPKFYSFRKCGDCGSHGEIKCQR